MRFAPGVILWLMVAQSSAALAMAALVAEKFDLRVERDRELIRQLTMFYIVQGYQIPPPAIGNER